MRVPLKWLAEYVDITRPAGEIGQMLTMSGAEASLETIGGDWDNIVIGQIKAINPHPNADRLLLPTVDLGGEEETVVCGAPNLKVGDKIAFARVGARLVNPYDGETITLTPAKIRGVASSGMVCSEKELGISDDHEGIMVLPPEAPLGTPLADYLGGTVLDLDITPNRADCLSVIGIAREVAALTGQKVHIPEVAYTEGAPAITGHYSVEIADPDLCLRYTASLITGVTIAPSPPWMQERLVACGMRPINNVVDITNYVMLEYGQPLHAFDGERITEGKIIVRRAEEGELLVTLDGVERKLSRDMLVIADPRRAVALAGVMGGASSEVTDATASILLESANFHPGSIHHTARTLGLPSEASMRFERGIQPGLAEAGLRRATQLLVKLASGTAAHGIIDAYPGKTEAAPISLTMAEMKRLLGADFTLRQATEALELLGFGVTANEKDQALTAAAPFWRRDISLPEDLVEEVARIIGYDKIPLTMLSDAIPRHDPEPIIALEREVRRCLTGYGCQEIITYSLCSLEALGMLSPEGNATWPEPLRLLNPMTADQEYLRPTLRANLLTTLAANRRHEDGIIRIFELGNIFLRKKDDLPDEVTSLCAVLSAGEVKNWHGEARPFDFYDAKGIAEGLISHLDVEAAFQPGNDPGLHPVRQASVMVDGAPIGVIGELHPRAAAAFEVEGPVFVIEIDVSALVSHTGHDRMFQPVPRFPGVLRDLAIIVDTGVSHQQVTEIIASFPLVAGITIFDVYSGGQVPAGKKSLAYRVVYQSASQTLVEEEVISVQAEILARLAKELGASLRA